MLVQLVLYISSLGELMSSFIFSPFIACIQWTCDHCFGLKLFVILVVQSPDYASVAQKVLLYLGSYRKASTQVRRKSWTPRRRILHGCHNPSFNGSLQLKMQESKDFCT